MLQAIAEIHRRRMSNREDGGQISNYALDLRLQREERRLVIEALGMEAEGGEPYAATTGEMLSWLRFG